MVDDVGDWRALFEASPDSYLILAPDLTIVAVTDAYTATRYGGIVPNEAEVTRVRQEWTTLEQKWRESSIHIIF